MTQAFNLSQFANNVNSAGVAQTGGGGTGTNIASNDLTVNGLTVGKGGGAVASNTAVGYQAGYSNTTGTYNTYLGYQSGSFTASGTGGYNSGVGVYALYSNTSGTYNSAFGHDSLANNTTGSYNTALGNYALISNTTASYNTAVGYQAGYSNTTSTSNAYFGNQSGYSTTTANGNTFIGNQAGYSSTGGNSTYVGQGAGYYVSSGAKNTIIGQYTGNQGGLDIRTSSNVIVLSDGDGNPRAYWDNVGNMTSPAIYTNTTASASNVFVFSSGQLGRSTSALKYKQDIRNLESIDINKFRPVIYKSKCEKDDQNKDHFGIIADEVDEAGFKELVTYGAEGEIEGFQYERFTVVLLKAIQELKAEFDAYKTTHP